MEDLLVAEKEIIIDEKVPFSRSGLWNFQREFYQQHSINAWDKKVPFYVTSNPYIANSYANIIIRFILDCKQTQNLDPDQPFHIVELGAGSGAFSFHAIKRIFELKESLSIDVKLVYIMTDLVQANIDFWRGHESFQPYVASGELDFAFFDAEFSKELVLLNSGDRIQPNEKNNEKNPTVFIANYVFDSLKQDVFHIDQNEIFEGLCKLTTEQSNLINDEVRQLDKVKISFSFSEVQLPYYHFEYLNQLLLHYKKTINEQYLSLPVGSLICLENLRALFGDKSLLISSDKGYSKHLEIYQKEPPAVAFHDNCFSLSVNFDSIGQYYEALGGDSFTQFTEQSLTTCAFMSGFKFDNMPETSLALETYLNSFGHTAINNLFLNYRATKSLTSIETIMPFLGASKWDVAAFNGCLDTIIKQMKSGCARKSDIEDLKEKVYEIERNFYRMPDGIDPFFDIGIFLQEARSYEEALNFYQKSILFFGEKDATLYNMGLCHYFLKNPEEAILKFEEALNHNPTSIMARGWIGQIENEIETV